VTLVILFLELEPACVSVKQIGEWRCSHKSGRIPNLHETSFQQIYEPYSLPLSSTFSGFLEQLSPSFLHLLRVFAVVIFRVGVCVCQNGSIAELIGDRGMMTAARGEREVCSFRFDLASASIKIPPVLTLVSHLLGKRLNLAILDYSLLLQLLLFNNFLSFCSRQLKI
jgi:hypothetical protein